MTADTETKPVAQTEEKKEEVKEEIKKEEEVNNAEEKADDKAEKPDKEKKEDEEKNKKKEKVVKPPKEQAAPKPTVHKADYEKDTVYLYQFSRTPVLPSVSPYCLKVETWLRLAGLKWENVDHKMKFKSKKGQLPFVEVNGEEIADSAIIIKELSQRYNINLDQHLTADQRNSAHANIMMIENHLAWVFKSFFYSNCDGFIKGFKVDLQKMVGRKIPLPLLNFFVKRHMKAAAKKVRAHGMGVHKPEEIEEFGRNDLQVLSDLLGEKNFFFGDEPSNLDVVAFSHLCQIVFLDESVEYSLSTWMNEHCSNLKDFCMRMKERAFSDWDEMCSTLDLNSHLPKPPKEEEKPEEKEAAEKPAAEETKDEKEKDDTEKEKAAKDEKEGEKDNKKQEEEKEKAEEKK